MIRPFITILILITSLANIQASDSTSTKPKKIFIYINGGMSSLFLKGPRQPYVESGANKDYDLRSGYCFYGGIIYQARSNEGYNFFVGLGYGMNKLSFTENLNYTNHATNKFQSFSYLPGSITTTLMNQQISFCVGLRKTAAKINLSHKLGCFYSFVSPRGFTNFYTKRELGSHYDGVTWANYTKDYRVTDNFTFKESICPYYGCDLGFRNKMLQPNLGFEVIYFTNDIVASSSESNFPVMAFDRAIMFRLYLGLTIGL
jgi:hypothetical protein